MGLTADEEVSAAELSSALHELGGRGMIGKPLMQVLERAGHHADLEVNRAALAVLTALPARAEQEGMTCVFHPEKFGFFPPRPELEADLRVAVEAHGLYWARRLGNVREAPVWFNGACPRFPLLRDLAKPYVVWAEPIRSAEDWQLQRWLLDIYLELLDDQEPERRQMACRGLLRFVLPTQELYERLQLQLGDPFTAELVEPGLANWRRRGR